MSTPTPTGSEPPDKAWRMDSRSMEFELQDYSSVHHCRIPEQRDGKFIQAFSAKCQYIVMAPKEMCAFHANIAERFFTGLGVNGRYNHKRDEFKVDHSGWTIAGGGHWRIDDAALTLELAGESMAYGRFISNGLARDIESALPGYKVIIKS